MRNLTCVNVGIVHWTVEQPLHHNNNVSTERPGTLNVSLNLK